VQDYRLFAVTVQGGSHIKSGLVCQDASDFYDDASVSIVVVADGHSDPICFRSDKGAEFAVNCAKEGMRQFVKELDTLVHGKHEDPSPALEEFAGLIREKLKREALKRTLDKPFLRELKNTQDNITALEEINDLIHRELDKLIREKLIKQIVSSWKNRVMEHYNANPFTEKDLENVDEKYRKRYEEGENINKAYGTSLIAAAITSWYWFGCHVGDGRFTVLYKDGTGDQPVPWDPRCFLNVTTSLCDDDILDRGEEGVRTCLFFHSQKAPPVALFICSDGVDDNFSPDEDENRKQLYSLYRNIGVTFAEAGFESTIRQITELANGYATKGRRDDTSLAGIVNIEKLKEVADEWKKMREAEDAEKERAKTEADAKAKAEAEQREKAEEEAAARRKKREEERAEAERAAAEEKAAAEKAKAEKAKAEAEQRKKADEEAAEKAKAAAEKTKAETEKKAAQEAQEAAAEKAAAEKANAQKVSEEYKKTLPDRGEFVTKVDILEGEKG
jgi:serine/threonine protein phosphatase PrpC